MRIEFLMAGSPNDAFYSQVAMFRLALDALGDRYRNARLVLCLTSSDGPSPMPKRWLPWFARIEVRWADNSHAARLTHGQDLFGMVDAGADISIICDADSMLLQPLPDEFLQDMETDPALCGVVGHRPPRMFNFDDFPPPANAMEMWQQMGAALGRPIALVYPYTLTPNDGFAPSFYINHGFLAAPPDLIRRLGVLQAAVRPALESVLINEFEDQIAVALAVEAGRLPHRRLPVRFNFPNNAVADSLYPDEMGNIVVLHYQFRKAFNRHIIFTTEQAFGDFMALPLYGSNAVFQAAVRRLTNGIYPFGTDCAAEQGLFTVAPGAKHP